MTLGSYYLHDPRVVLLPIERLGPSGMDAALAELLRTEAGWEAERVALFDRGFALYWSRSASLAARTRTWPAPRLRHVAVVGDAGGVRPYAQMLNTSAWTLWQADLDPASSHAELVAFLLAHGERMALTGEVTLAAVQTAAWWLERSEDECRAFAAAAARSTRPDAEGFRAIADALPWLRTLRHETLAPPARIALAGAASPGPRAVPGTGLLVPAAIEAEPPALVERWTETARQAVAAFHSRWRTPDPTAVASLLEWLAAAAPPLLVTGRGGRVLWEPDSPSRIGGLRQELRGASGAGVRDIAADLHVVADRTGRFLDALAEPAALPRPRTAPEQRGYAYLHGERRLIAYNLHEPGTERLLGPALPYARAMLGARTIHEWCHLAVDAGWVPAVDEDAVRAGVEGLGDLLERVVHDAPLALRHASGSELAGLGPHPGRALAAGITDRFDDYRANLLAARFLDLAEQETYVRQNVRTLRAEMQPSRLFHTLVRYAYEYQYLRFSLVEDRREYFLRSTWFDDDFLRTRVLDDERFDALVAAVGAICELYAVDESRFRTPV